MRPVTFFHAWEGSRRPGQAFLQAWFPLFNENYCLKWLKTHSLSRFYWATHRKESCAGSACYMAQREWRYILFWETTDWKWRAVFQSHSQRSIQKKWLSSCSLNLYFQGCVSKCWLLLVERKGSSHVPLSQYCPCLGSGSEVQKHLNGRKTDFP